MEVNILGAIALFLVVTCIYLIWVSTGCKGRYLLHKDWEWEFYTEISHQSPQFDEETGEAYAKKFNIYKEKCQRCGWWNTWSQRIEEKEERRWEPDTLKEIMKND